MITIGFPAAANASSSPSDADSGLSVGAEAGIGVGVAAVVLLILGLGTAAWVFHRRLGKARKSGVGDAKESRSDDKVEDFATDQIVPEMDAKHSERRLELDDSERAELVGCEVPEMDVAEANVGRRRQVGVGVRDGSV